MNINRHNYEEHFILYMDNELGSDDRRQVEDFVQKHPDLKEELDILLQYKMEPDKSVVFNDKEKLMHGEYSLVSMTNYEEWFVLYIDDELNAEQKKAVEEFIAEHPSLKDEFALMQRTQLRPEKIIFPGRESLYKRRTPVISVRWRIAAAAILLFVIATTLFITLNKKSSVEPAIVIKPIDKQATDQQAQVTQNDNKKKEEVAVISNTVEKHIALKTKQAENKIPLHNNTTNKKQEDNSPVKKDEPVIVNKQQPSNNLPQPIKKSNIKMDEAIAETSQNNPDKINNSQSSLTNNIVTNNSSQPSNVVYNPDENINQPDAKKGKLRGFLRKLTRTFEKTTKIDPTDNEDRVLIGGLALKLK